MLISFPLPLASLEVTIPQFYLGIRQPALWEKVRPRFEQEPLFGVT